MATKMETQTNRTKQRPEYNLYVDGVWIGVLLRGKGLFLKWKSPWQSNQERGWNNLISILSQRQATDWEETHNCVDLSEERQASRIHTKHC